MGCENPACAGDGAQTTADATAAALDPITARREADNSVEVETPLLTKDGAKLSTTTDDAQKAVLLSEGISEALNCTAFGLMVAVVAIAGYGYFMYRINHMVNDMTESSMSLMNLVASNRDKIKS